MSPNTYNFIYNYTYVRINFGMEKNNLKDKDLICTTEQDW